MAGNTVHNQVSDNVNHPLDLKAPVTSKTVHNQVSDNVNHPLDLKAPVMTSGR